MPLNKQLSGKVTCKTTRGVINTLLHSSVPARIGSLSNKNFESRMFYLTTGSTVRSIGAILLLTNGRKRLL